MRFKIDSALDEAKDMMRAAMLQLPDGKGHVWLDSALVWEHMQKDGLSETDVVDDPRTRTISVRGALLGLP